VNVSSIALYASEEVTLTICGEIFYPNKNYNIKGWTEMFTTYGRYLVIVPVMATDLDLLAFDKRHTWLRFWEDLRELNGKIIGQQFKLSIYVEDPKRKPTKLFFSMLIDSPSEEDAYEEGMSKVEEFLSIMNVLLRRGFGILAYEVATLPLPSVRSLKEIELDIDGEYITKVNTPYGNWTVLSLISERLLMRKSSLCILKCRRLRERSLLK
jgi:hypothetical protein